MKRFEYSRMTAAQFNNELSSIDWRVETFAKIFGVNLNTASKWARDKQDIPPWVYVAFRLLKIHGGLVVARDAAEEHILIDNFESEE